MILIVFLPPARICSRRQQPFFSLFSWFLPRAAPLDRVPRGPDHTREPYFNPVEVTCDRHVFVSSTGFLPMFFLPRP